MRRRNVSIKKLLLIQPPIQDFYDTEVRLQPIGLAYLKASVRQYLPHWQVKILDFHHGWGRRTVAVPKELAYLKEYYPYSDSSPFCGFHQYYHFGASFEEIARQVVAEQPDLVGISSLFSPYYREVLNCAQVIKNTLSVDILVGGSHVSADPLSMLNHPAVDFVIRGEGERPLVKFLQAWESERNWSQVPNLGYRQHGQNILNPQIANYPMEEIPMPDLGDFSLENYRYEGKPMSFLVSSRSCPHRCSFCSVHATFGLDYRRNSVARVLEEIRQRYREGYRVIDFEDDNLSFYTQEMKELCRRLIEEFPHGEMQFLAMNGISYLSLDEELLGLMRRAGFTHLNLALVTSDTTVRESTKRPHTVEKFLQVVLRGHALGFKITAYQILGLPNESLESMVQTMVFLARLPVLLGASPFYLTPHSPIAKQMGHVAGPEDIFKARLTAMAIETEKFQREDLYTLFLTTRILDFLKGLKISAAKMTWDDLMEPDMVRLCDERTRLGLEILSDLLATGVLHAMTSKGLQPVKKFKTSLFQSLWRDLGYVTTQEGKVLQLKSICLRPPIGADIVARTIGVVEAGAGVTGVEGGGNVL